MSITVRLGRRAVLTSILVASALWAGDVTAGEKLRISLDTNPSHVRNKGVELFVEKLKSKVGDRLDIEVFPSGQLYRDRDVARALRQGSVEMAIPGTWVLDGMEPSFALTSLPIFFGINEAATLDLMDGPVGREINRHAEERLKVKVLGRWMNLGFSHYYSTKQPLKSHDDLKALKLRISGGTANAIRAEGFGAIPNLIAWPDVPLALSSSVVDAISSTHESVASAKLWDSGLSYALEDDQWFAQYVPMVSATFWGKLSPELQKEITEVWDQTIDETRKMAAKAQLEARQAMLDHGMVIVTSDEAELARSRAKLMPYQPKLIEEMKIDPKLVEMTTKELKSRGLTN